VVELEQQIEPLFRSIREGAAPLATGDDGRWAVLMCLAAQRSVDEARPVAVDELRGTA